MTSWSHIHDQIAQLSDAGTPLPIWWRDDDAVEHTGALDQLTALANRYDIAVHLAVIPKFIKPSLADALTPRTIAVTHGLAHENHAPEGQKRAEFGDHRQDSAVADDLRQGAEAMAALNLHRSPMFVPPWNRIGAIATALLPGFGYRYLSTYNSRKNLSAAPGVTQVNTHLDPIEWHGSRSLLPEDAILNELSKNLSGRLNGTADAAEPFGLLTHHLVHDQAIWDFTDRALEELLSAPVNLWEAERIGDQP